MAFELPADSPLQNLQSTAETIGHIVAAYTKTLQREGLPLEIVIPLTVQYARQFTDRIYSLPQAAGSPGPQITITRKNPPPAEE
jgi:hypothetical protein